jgi:hypothetical protein
LEVVIEYKSPRCTQSWSFDATGSWCFQILYWSENLIVTPCYCSSSRSFHLLINCLNQLDKLQNRFPFHSLIHNCHIECQKSNGQRKVPDVFQWSQIQVQHYENSCCNQQAIENHFTCNSHPPFGFSHEKSVRDGKHSKSSKENQKWLDTERKVHVRTYRVVNFRPINEKPEEFVTLVKIKRWLGDK